MRFLRRSTRRYALTDLNRTPLGSFLDRKSHSRSSSSFSSSPGKKGRARRANSFNETRRAAPKRLSKVAVISHVDPLARKSSTHPARRRRWFGIQDSTGQFRKDARTWRRVLFAPLGHRENSLYTLGGNRARLNAPAVLSNASLYAENHYGRQAPVCSPSIHTPPVQQM